MWQNSERNFGPNARVPRHLESLRKKLISRVALLGRFGGKGWSAKQGCGVGGKISDSQLRLRVSKISDSDSEFPEFPTPNP